MKKEPLRWGILATGFIAKQFASDLKYCQGSVLKAVASRSQESAERFAEEFGVEHVYTSYEELAESDEVDVIYIATPHHLHHPNAKMCMQAGKHVLIEKPMSLNAEQSRDLVKIAQAKGVFMMEAMWSRFIPAVKSAIEAVVQGEIGELTWCKGDFGFKAERNPEHRLFKKAFGGGSLLDVGIYPLSLATFFLGLPRDIKAHQHIGPTKVDEQCYMTLDYGRAKAELYSAITVDTQLAFMLGGTLGTLEFVGPLFAPTGYKVKLNSGQCREVSLPFEGSGYQFEAMAVEEALIRGQTQHEDVSWERSTQIAELMDKIHQCSTPLKEVSGDHLKEKLDALAVKG